MQIRDLGWKKLGSRIRDKHSASATLTTGILEKLVRETFLISTTGCSEQEATIGCLDVWEINFLNRCRNKGRLSRQDSLCCVASINIEDPNNLKCSTSFYYKIIKGKVLKTSVDLIFFVSSSILLGASISDDDNGSTFSN
jgi:hypothetical protein